MASFNLTSGLHPDRVAQIASLLAKKVRIPDECSDFADAFSEVKTLMLPERIEFNGHTIDLEDSKHSPYGPIYNLGPVTLETLKTYIKTYLKTRFIQPSKSPAGAFILYDKKLDSSFRLGIDYRGHNKLKIKNRYPLSLIGELLNWLRRAKRFTQLDLTSAYHRMRIKEGDEWKTAFRTRYGHFEYQVMPFGLSNAPTSFQDYINKVLAEKLDIFVIMYLNDIFIYTKDRDQGHMEVVWWALHFLRKMACLPIWRNVGFIKMRCNSQDTLSWATASKWRMKESK